MPYRKNKKRLLEKLEENTFYEQLDEESLELLSELLNVPSIWKNRKKYMKKTKDREEFDMCQAIRELIEDGKQEGKLDLLFELVREGLLAMEDAAKKADFSVSEFEKRMLTSN